MFGLGIEVGKGDGVGASVGVGVGETVGETVGEVDGEAEGDALALALTLGVGVGVAALALIPVVFAPLAPTKTNAAEIPSARTVFVKIEEFSRLGLTTLISLTFRNELPLCHVKHVRQRPPNQPKPV